MRHIILSLFVVLFLASCSSTKKPERPGYGTESGEFHIVKKGDTLTSIAWHYGTTTSKIMALNNISEPNRLLVGQNLAMTNNKSSSTFSTPISRPKVYVRKANWAWPIRGKIIRTFNPRRIGGKQIRIRGKLGQTVNAAENGKVEYKGGGLKGYGQVVIIRHDNGYLSAYGFLGEPVVKKGQYVKKRQKIGTVGISTDRKPALLFEVRRHGKPVNPLHYIGYKYNF